MTHVTDILSAQSVLSTGVSEDVVWIQGRASFRSPDCLHQQARDWADSTAGGRIISRLHLITTYIYILSISLLCKPELKDTYNVRNIFTPPSHRNISPCVIHLTISSKTHWTIEICYFLFFFIKHFAQTVTIIVFSGKFIYWVKPPRGSIKKLKVRVDNWSPALTFVWGR